MKKKLLPVLVLGVVFSVMAQQDKRAHIRFIFENPKLQPANYVIDINEDGSGHFHSVPGSAVTSDPDGVVSQPIDMDIKIEEPLRSSLFKIARAHNFFDVACDSTKTKVAFTGKKALVYSGPDGDGSCTFNWSRDQQIMKVADDLIATAYTLEVGSRLTVEREHDRLSLDSELEALQDAVKGGRAQQVQNISPQLQSIADDEKVMERARNRARQLLNGSKAG
ncbi:MAG TPA: hypothetical protein VHT24_15495 [Pseudacidobacterium sp.]|jgi:hypothetical protein|nr:hypothetical protein [Pseudacidobacterium sp.]